MSEHRSNPSKPVPSTSVLATELFFLAPSAAPYQTGPEPSVMLEGAVIDQKLSSQEAYEKGVAALLLHQFRDALPLLQHAAKGGEWRAELFLGMACADAQEWGVKQNEAQAKLHFDQVKRNLDTGNELFQQVAVGILGFYGHDVYTNRKSVAECFQSAAGLGDPLAQYLLGRCYQLGKGGVGKNVPEAMKWFLKVSPKSTSALIQLGLCHIEGQGDIPKNAKQGLVYLQQAATQKDAWAATLLGDYYTKVALKNEKPVGNILESLLGKRYSKEYLDNAKQAVFWYQQATAQGHPEAQNQLGLCFFKEQMGIVKDEKQAFFWFQQSAAQGYAKGQNNLGYCYYEGIATPKDIKQAATFFQFAAEQGDEAAQYGLGYCYLKGRGVSRNATQAVAFFQSAAEQGLRQAQYELGHCYLHGIGVELDRSLATNWLVKAAAQGHSDAIPEFRTVTGMNYSEFSIRRDKTDKYIKDSIIFKVGEKDLPALYEMVSGYLGTEEILAGPSNENYHLAMQYLHGNGVTKDSAKAVSLLKKAQKQGHVEASYQLGLCCFHNIIDSSDVDVRSHMFEYFRQAAEKGHLDAQYFLGRCYLEGRCVPKDEKQAILHFVKAAEQGNANAQNGLGYCYYEGIGVPKDEKQAVSYFQPAAAKGNADAQYCLGYCYLKGTGVPKDEKQAAILFQSAADQVHKVAQYELGCCYLYGIGVEQNQVLAIRWLKKSASQGHPSAIDKVKELEPPISVFSSVASFFGFNSPASERSAPSVVKPKTAPFFSPSEQELQPLVPRSPSPGPDAV